MNIIARSNFGRRMLLMELDSKDIENSIIQVGDVEYKLKLFLKFCVSESWIFTKAFLEK